MNVPDRSDWLQLGPQSPRHRPPHRTDSSALHLECPPATPVTEIAEQAVIKILGSFNRRGRRTGVHPPLFEDPLAEPVVDRADAPLNALFPCSLPMPAPFR